MSLVPTQDLGSIVVTVNIRRAYVGVDPIAGFKPDLDKFLTKIPDQSYIQALAKSAKSNWLVDQIIYINKSQVK
jgi:hypothetical protein